MSSLCKQMVMDEEGGGGLYFIPLRNFNNFQFIIKKKNKKKE